MICCICNNAAFPRLKRGEIQYFQCSNCKTLFSGPIENDNMVGGGNEEQRNRVQNSERIDRIESFVKDRPKDEVWVLDFGCGHGLLVEELKKKGYENTIGYDAFNDEFSSLPPVGKFQICICVECIEHTAIPYVELDVINRSLINGGVLILETSFVDVAQQEGIALEDFPYIEPKVGHSTIFSHHGLDVLLLRKGFYPIAHENRHVRYYQKYSNG